MSLQTSKKVAKNTFLLYARMGLTVLISLYATRLILNALGVSDFGLFNLIGGAIAMLGFLNIAMASATQRFMSYAEGVGDINKQKNIFNISILLHVLIAIIIVLSLEVGSYVFFSGFLNISADRLYASKVVYQFLIISTCFTILSVPFEAVLNAHENMFFIAILGVFEALLKLAVALFVANVNADKLIVYSILTALSTIILMLVRIVYTNRMYSEVRINLKRYFDKVLFREMYKYAGWSFLGSIISVVSNTGQSIIINIFFGTKMNAAQGVAGQVNGQISVFSSTMLSALNPAIVKTEGKGERNKMLRMSVFGSKLSFYILSLFAIPIFIELPYIMKLWLINIPDYAITFCRLLIIKTLIEQIVGSMPVSINAIGNIKYYQVFMSLMAILPLPVSFIMYKLNYPPEASYYLYILQAFVCSFFIIPYFVKANAGFKLSESLKSLFIPSLLVFVITFFATWMVHLFIEHDVMRVAAVLLVSTFLLLPLFWIFGIDKNERLQLQNLLMSIYLKFNKGSLTSYKP
jgi:O-antigen/teichoic acid export membrane protein